MRILQINNLAEGGGAEVDVINLKHFLDDNGIENAVAFFDKIPDDLEEALRIYCPLFQVEKYSNLLSSRTRFNSASRLFQEPNTDLSKRISINLRKLIATNDPITRFFARRAIKSFNPDIVQIHKILPSLAPLHLAHDMGLKTSITVHGYWMICPKGNLIRRDGSPCDSISWMDCPRFCSLSFINVDSYMKTLQETVIEKADLIICVSEFVKNRLLDFGYPASKICRIYNGVEEMPTFGSYCQDRPFVLFFGRPTVHKGPHIFIEAARIAERLRLEVDFILIGIRDNNRLAKNDFSDNIRLKSWLRRADLAQYIKASLCSVIPSVWHEPLGLTAIESISCGTPCIGTRMGGIPEIVDDGLSGYLIDLSDKQSAASAIVDRIRELLLNPDLRHKMSIACREKYEQEFTLKAMGDNYIEQYRHLEIVRD